MANLLPNLLPLHTHEKKTLHIRSYNGVLLLAKVK